MNYCTAWVDVVGRAAAAERGRLAFHRTTRFRGNGSLLPHDADYDRAFAVDGHERIEVDAEPLDVHLGRFEAIRLVRVDVKGGEEQVFAGMERLLASGAVEQVCFELLSSHLGAAWEAHADRLRGMVAAGWSIGTLDADGGVAPTPVERILDVGAFSQVVLGAPRS
jgi:FkbM family methyltransferase